MTGPNRENIRRRFGHAFAFLTGKAYVRKADMAESPLGWALGRGIHRKFLSVSTLPTHC
jgi:hypothetical protein